ncbi:MAG: transposase [Thermogutta sp.]
MLEDEIGETDEKHRQFVGVCERCAPQDYLSAYRWMDNGCPPRDRLSLCKTFIAKAVWDFGTTRDLIDAIRHRPALRRLCGWETLGEVPSEATFSRTFDAFARDGRPQQIHEALIQTHYSEKLAGHISRDATAIHAREKAAIKPKATPKSKRRQRGRQPKNEPIATPPEPKRLQPHLARDWPANLADLPTACAWCCLMNPLAR